MADLNARIKPKKSSTAGEVPLAADLEVAELAVNTADGKLFVKHTDDSVKEISGSGGGGGVSTVNGDSGPDVSLGVGQLSDYALLPQTQTFSGCTNKQNTYGTMDESGEWYIGNSNAVVDTFFTYNIAQDAVLGQLTVGAVVTFSAAGVSDVVANVIEVNTPGPADNYFRIDVDFPQEWLDLPDGSACTITSSVLAIGLAPLADGDILVYNYTDNEWNPQQPSGIPLDTLKSVTAASTDFADFQARIAAL